MIRKTDNSAIQSYLEDSSNLKGGFAANVTIPDNADELSAVLKEANADRVCVTVSGAGTGNSGGRIPFGGIVVSTERLNACGEVYSDPNGTFIKCEAGLRVSELQERLSKAGYFYPYDPTEQNAFIGGTIATNASGARSFKYGATRSSVQELKILLADGRQIRLKRGVTYADGLNIRLPYGNAGETIEVPIPSYKMPGTKNSAGYFAMPGMDVIDLFIGQEGTLGVIVEATIRVLKKGGIFGCFVFFKENDRAITFSRDAAEISRKNRGSGSDINAISIEYFDKNALDILRSGFPNIPGDALACVFVEQETLPDTEGDVMASWTDFIGLYEVRDDCVWAGQNAKEISLFKKMRHYVPEKMNELVRQRNMSKVSTDLAVPTDSFPAMLKGYEDLLSSSGMQSFLFGHIGDSHLHMNLLPANREEYKTAKDIAMKLIKMSVGLGGTVSAEHGIGKSRREYLKILYGDKGVSEMLETKRALDPNFILNRGDVFDIPLDLLKEGR